MIIIKVALILVDPTYWIQLLTNDPIQVLVLMGCILSSH